MLEILPLVCMLSRLRRDMNWWTCSKIPGVQWIILVAMDIRTTRSFSDKIEKCFHFCTELSCLVKYWTYGFETVIFQIHLSCWTPRQND